MENRAKVARAVVQAVRAAVDEDGGGRIAVTAKLNMADGVDGGITVEESLQTAKWLQDDGGLDALELTAGSSLVNPMYLFRGDAPGKDIPAMAKIMREYPYHDAYLLDDARLFRAELTMPLILLGGITNRETMDKAMAEGFDFVAMGRALLAEPDLLNRIQADGDAHTVKSVCTHTNECMTTIYSHTHVLRCTGLSARAPRRTATVRVEGDESTSRTRADRSVRRVAAHLRRRPRRRRRSRSARRRADRPSPDIAGPRAAAVRSGPLGGHRQRLAERAVRQRPPGPRRRHQRRPGVNIGNPDGPQLSFEVGHDTGSVGRPTADRRISVTRRPHRRYPSHRRSPVPDAAAAGSGPDRPNAPPAASDRLTPAADLPHGPHAADLSDQSAASDSRVPAEHLATGAAARSSGNVPTQMGPTARAAEVR